MAAKRSVKSVANRVTKEQKEYAKRTADSFQNFALSLGMGTDNALSGSTYGFNPVTRNRMLLEWVYRGSWIGGVAIDIIADDMTRAGVSFQGTISPKDSERLEAAGTRLSVWNELNDAVKWARLYGGSIAVLLIDGQDPTTPLRLETVGRNQFKGLLVLDRWMLQPSLDNLVQEYGPDLGLPKFYQVNSDAPALPMTKIHHSRVIRLEGIKLPYLQRLSENMWGLSIVERLYDRMVAFDSATQGAAQLVYKSFLRTLKLKDFREAVAVGGDALNGVVQQVALMRKFQSIEGISVIDGDDELQVDDRGSFSGISDALVQFGQQLSGALQIPLVRLFGQSPAGLSSTGESDLRTYYDGIKTQQNKELHTDVTKVYKVIARSEGINLPNDFSIEFKSLWELSDEAKATIANTTATAVATVYDSGIIDKATGLSELRQSSHVTGIFNNVTDEDIEAAKAEPPPPDDIGPPGVFDHARLMEFGGMPVRIETAKGETRYGDGWQSIMAADYGYFEGTSSAEGHHEGLDCFVGDDLDCPYVWIIDQLNADTGAFDEHKVMVGYSKKSAAIRDYMDSYSDDRGLERIGAVTKMPLSEFKTWAVDSSNKANPYKWGQQ